MKKDRSIFVEVDGRDNAQQEPATMSDATGSWQHRRAIRAWLVLLLGAVILTILVGGATRLLDAGLSITEWKPVTGILPPFGNADWLSEFEKYKQIPEFTLQNSQMSLAEFKSIYWLEWGHRQLGRVLGVIWVVGFLWFVLGRKLRPGWAARLLLLGVLGGVQGAVGWWMVQSGLSGSAVDVSSYRLAFHLVLAFAISGLIFWYVLVLGHEPYDLFRARRSRDVDLRRSVGTLLAALIIQVILGALVSGIDAGAAYPTWPLMNGEFFPSGGFSLEPMVANFTENPGLVQFNHRIAAYLIAAWIVFVWWKGRKNPNPTVRTFSNWLLAAGLLQVGLGITAAVSAATPTISILHQAGSVVLFLVTVKLMFLGSYPTGSNVR